MKTLAAISVTLCLFAAVLPFAHAAPVLVSSQVVTDGEGSVTCPAGDTVLVCDYGDQAYSYLSSGTSPDVGSSATTLVNSVTDTYMAPDYYYVTIAVWAVVAPTGGFSSASVFVSTGSVIDVFSGASNYHALSGTGAVSTTYGTPFSDWGNEVYDSSLTGTTVTGHKSDVVVFSYMFLLIDTGTCEPDVVTGYTSAGLYTGNPRVGAFYQEFDSDTAVNPQLYIDGPPSGGGEPIGWCAIAIDVWP